MFEQKASDLHLSSGNPPILRVNGELQRVAKTAVDELLPPRVRAQFETFAQCRECAAVYWPGSHYDRMRRMIEFQIDRARTMIQDLSVRYQLLGEHRDTTGK